MGYLISAFVGVLVGGLINLLADDLPERRKPARPHCPQCGQQYRPALLLGIMRRIRGRCESCGAPERWRPILVELGTALLFAFLWGWSGGWSARLLVYAVYFAVFVLILVTDLEHRLILHVVTFPAIAFALLASFFTVTPMAALLGALTGFVVFFLIYVVGGLVFGAGAMGFGDVTLSTLIGAAAGFPMVIVALLNGILVGGVVSILLLLLRVRRVKSKVPYGPFLLIGGVTALLWGEQIVTWYLR